MATVVYSNTKRIVKVDSDDYERDLLEGLLRSEGIERDNTGHPKIGLTGRLQFYKSRNVGLLYVTIIEFDHKKSPYSTNLFVANGSDLKVIDNLVKKIRELYESMGYKPEDSGHGVFG
ncbi:hypothetical protein KY342_05560 [Candidatus Woesearchaeota archaeon]|nr:hypothetical protein [Candidatus Woesearchaeota archaeon]